LTIDPSFTLVAAQNQQFGLQSYGAAIALVSGVIVAQSCMASWISTIYLASSTRNQDTVTIPSGLAICRPFRVQDGIRFAFGARMILAGFGLGGTRLKLPDTELALPQLRPGESVF
jgi:hypothetical protein